MTLGLVMIGAALGAPARWALDRQIQLRHSSLFPWGTLTINVLGSLILGVLLAVAAPASLVALLGIGFCGGFTTFSTFSFEVVRMSQEAHGRLAATYAAMSLAAGMCAAFLGWWVGSTFV